jgi:transcriptional regulator with XRE-family HTH domain
VASEVDAGGGLGASLRALRLAAGMTQEDLAEAAGISTRTVSDVERGLRTIVHTHTADRLASALGLAGEPRRAFRALARGRPPPEPPVPPAGRLPWTPTRLLGRGRELATIRAILDGDVRLLTLTGPGGIGKTRLAVEAARHASGAFAGGVFFVSLGEVRDASLVAPQVAKAIGVIEAGADLPELIAARLAERRALVVLDTFEHLIPAAPLVYELLRSCPASAFVVTSRIALRLRGEQEVPVPPLDVAPATALFWERARAVRPDLAPDADAEALAAGICRGLDCLPLAIELAATRLKHLPIGALRDQLGHRLGLLVGGPLDGPPRQRTMRDTLAWSLDLVGKRQATLFRRLAVFSGGWRLDAVDDVCGSAEEIGDALGGISALVDASGPDDGVLSTVHAGRLPPRRRCRPWSASMDR